VARGRWGKERERALVEARWGVLEGAGAETAGAEEAGSLWCRDLSSAVAVGAEGVGVGLKKRETSDGDMVMLVVVGGCQRCVWRGGNGDCSCERKAGFEFRTCCRHTLEVEMVLERSLNYREP